MKEHTRPKRKVIRDSLPYEALLPQIARLVPALIVVYNIKTGDYIYVNDGCERVLGYPKETFLEKGMPFVASIVHPDDLPRIMAENGAALKTAHKQSPKLGKDPVVTFEYRMRHKDGSWRWLQSDGVVYSRDAKGKVTHVMNVSMDITKRKEAELQAEQKLLLENKRVTTIVQSLAEGIYGIDAEANCTFINTAAATLFGYTEKECIGKNMHDLTHHTKADGRHYPANECPSYKAFRRGKVVRHVEETLWRKDGTPIRALFSVTPVIEKEKVVSGVVTVVDIGPRKKIEEDLRQSQERYKMFIANSLEGIWRFELEKPISTSLSIKKQIDLMYTHGYLAECNDAFAHMYAVAKAEKIVGARLSDLLLRADEKNTQYLTTFIEAGYKLTNAESVEVDKKGEKRYFQNNLVGIIEDGKLVRAWGTQLDITEQKRLEQQKDAFLGVTSHELKTPVTSLKAYAQVLYKRFLKEENRRAAELLGKMDNQLDKLTTLISDLLDVTKIESGKLQFAEGFFDLNELLSEVVEEVQRTTEQHKILCSFVKTKTVYGDRERIGQVVTNLLTNAIKYSPDARKIIVETAVKKGEIVVCVRDFGLGIPKDQQQKVFDRFFRVTGEKRLTYPGLGIGLFISSEIIKRHGGKIWLESKEGKGSTFYFSLPIRKKM